jgi:TldD protein
VEIERKVELLRRADAAARSYDERIFQATVLYRDLVRELWVANSEGVFDGDQQTHSVLYVIAVGKEGELIQTGMKAVAETKGFELFEEETPEEVAEEAARRAIVQLEARPAPAGTFAVVLSSEAGGTMIHEACGHGLEGDFVKRGLSVYAGKVGERVASELITIVDDGTLPNKRGTSKMDDEGHPTQRVVLIEDGMLKGYLHSRKSALETGLPRTGNGRRSSFRHLPIPRMCNTFVAPGKTPPEEIVASLEDGILVKQIGGGQVDPVSGHFVFQVMEAYLIRDGQMGEPIRGATLTGNGPQVLEEVDMVGDDLGFAVGTCGKDGQGVPVSDAQPTLRLPSIVVGGMVEE